MRYENEAKYHKNRGKLGQNPRIFIENCVVATLVATRKALCINECCNMATKWRKLFICCSCLRLLYELLLPSRMLANAGWNASVSQLECKCFAAGMQAFHSWNASISWLEYMRFGCIVLTLCYSQVSRLQRASNGPLAWLLSHQRQKAYCNSTQAAPSSRLIVCPLTAKRPRPQP